MKAKSITVHMNTEQGRNVEMDRANKTLALGGRCANGSMIRFVDTDRDGWDKSQEF